MIAAARLGLSVTSCGHVGDDAFGAYLLAGLREEGVRHHEALTTGAQRTGDTAATLVCFVLVERGTRRHAFCSAYDFGPWPLLAGAVPTVAAVAACRRASALMLNGFLFDEMAPEVVLGLLRDATAAGSAVIFDPGPRCESLLRGGRRSACAAVVDAAAAVLLTEEEAAAFVRPSGHEPALATVTPELVALAAAADIPDSARGAAASCCALLARRPAEAVRWVIIKLGEAGAVLAGHRERVSHGSGPQRGVDICYSPAFRVDVRDTVGCGDAFAAAVVMGLTRGWDAAVTLTLASAVGAATATRPGAGRNVASRDAVLSLLRQAVRSKDVATSAACEAVLSALGQDVTAF